MIHVYILILLCRVASKKSNCGVVHYNSLWANYLSMHAVDIPDSCGFPILNCSTTKENMLDIATSSKRHTHSSILQFVLSDQKYEV
mmetsp:Transcript_46493/g.90814  ORF Transcript_46493/g.90814 Transcript_46493/m.90814 type:complete len:86 (+) Transcript_46493:1213-1470(+)